MCSIFFYPLPGVQNLCIGNSFLELLTLSIEPHKLPKLCWELVFLAIEMYFNDKKTSLIALSIFTIAPNLRKLKVRPCDETISESPSGFWEDGCWNNTFTKLQLVEVIGISGTKLELDFIKFVLSNSPVLERIVFRVRDGTDQPELIMEQVLSLRHFSDRAEVIYSDDIVWFDELLCGCIA